MIDISLIVFFEQGRIEGIFAEFDDRFENPLPGTRKKIPHIALADLYRKSVFA